MIAQSLKKSKMLIEIIKDLTFKVSHEEVINSAEK
jgi:hypothetical protein